MTRSVHDNPIFNLFPIQGKLLRITGITFTSNSSSQTTNNGLVSFNENTTLGDTVHFDQNDCNQVKNICLSAGVPINGVWDHNVLTGKGSGTFHVAGESKSDDGGDSQWAAATGIGTSNFLFIENNVITNGGDDCQAGGRFVIRYNSIISGSAQSNLVINHPTGGDGGWPILCGFTRCDCSDIYDSAKARTQHRQFMCAVSGRVPQPFAGFAKGAGFSARSVSFGRRTKGPTFENRERYFFRVCKYRP